MRNAYTGCDMPYPVNAIANAFLNKAAGEGERISHLKLQKLMYYASGYYLALHNKPLIDNMFEAWEYGPVVPALYREFRDFGLNPITRLAKSSEWDEDALPAAIPIQDEEVNKIIDFVWKNYSKYSALQLSDMTHAERSPWDRTRKEKPGIRNADIPDEFLKEHFQKLIKPRRNTHV